MKNEKGITLLSLVIYVAVMIITIPIMSSIIQIFYNNSEDMQVVTKDIINLNKFNTYILKEIKNENNKVEEIDENGEYISFSSSNYFIKSGDNIFFNKVKICEGVEEFQVSSGKDGDGQDDSIICITIGFKSFSKTINYKIEKIY